MSSISFKDKRNVLPNWRSYSKTARLGELFSVHKEKHPIPLFNLSKYIEAWEEQGTISYAGDLISAAMVNGQIRLPQVISAAKFILSHGEVPDPLRKLASVILVVPSSTDTNEVLSTSNILDGIVSKESATKELIRFIRQENALFPYNPIAYCELSRCYTLLGLGKKAVESMGVALHLAPQSRYISRCAARLFLQIGDIDRAHSIVTNNPALKSDPWLLASEIAINSTLGRNSRYAKYGLAVLSSDSLSPYCCSELASALGTLELANGGRKKSIKLLNKALIAPNDNSLAQAEWIVGEYKNLPLKFGDYSSLPLKSEADARFAFLTNNFEKSLIESVHWMEDLPYDKNPILFGSNIAHTFLKDYTTAARILKIGLIANPNDAILLNNLAYVMALGGDANEAIPIIENPAFNDASLPIDSIICHIATTGLINFRTGNIEHGRELYLEAINLAKEKGSDAHLINKAILNYLREEIIAKSCSLQDIQNILEKINPVNDKEMEQLKFDVIAEGENTNINSSLIKPFQLNIDNI